MPFDLESAEDLHPRTMRNQVKILYGADAIMHEHASTSTRGLLGLKILTIGHSTRTLNELICLLGAHGVQILADVRSVTRSRANPQFNRDVIEMELPKHDITYVWIERLGGRRKGLGKGSKNTCWRSRAFRNYADYMETSLFRDGINELIELANTRTVAIMCAEAVYWRCHRSMIADFLKSLGVQVVHILGEKQTREHEYNEWARIRDGSLTYHD